MLTLKFIRIIQTLFVLYTVLPCMSAHAALNDCTYCLISQGQNKERGGGRGAQDFCTIEYKTLYTF